MASRHHNACSRRHNHNNQIPLVVPTSPRCCTFRDSPPCCCTHSNHPSPPPPDNLHHLLAYYLQTHQQETHFPNQTCSCNHKNLPRQHDDQVILSSLQQKINNLESSLNKFAPFYDQRRDRYSTSLRDSAARVIQTHFRSYLVYRSISFRHLKELAVIKSSFLSLKSSVSGKPIFPYKVVSRKATDLLLQLDSIQGRVDPMIRSSKRSLSRDLVRFLQYVDDCVVRRYGYVTKSAANVSFVGSSHSKKPQTFGVAEDGRVEKVFVTCDGDEELDSTTDDSEEVSVDKRKTRSSKFRTGAKVVKPPVSKTMVLDKNRNVYQVYGKTSAEDRTVERLRNRVGKVLVTCDGDEDSSAELEELDSTTDGSEELPVGSTDKREAGSSKFRNGAIVKGNVVKLPVRQTMVLNKNRNVYGNKHDVASSGEDDSVDSGEEESLVISRDNQRKQHGLKARSVVVVNGKNRVVKTVRFDEDGNVYKVYGNTPEESISEEGDDDSTSGSNNGNGDKKGNEVEEIKYVPKENEGFEEEDEEETQSENEVSSSDGSEGDATGSNEHKKRELEVQKGSLMFSPPLPLKMEP